MDDKLDEVDDLCQSVAAVTIQDQHTRRVIQCTDGMEDSFYEEDRYDFSHIRRGIAIIIVNDMVPGGEPRKGCKEDVTNFETMFTHLNFEIRRLLDKTSEEILKALQTISKEDFKNCDCLALAVSTHGGETFRFKNQDRVRDDFVYTKNGAIKTSDLLQMFTDSKCPSLEGKPRLVFLQACRGENFDDGMDVKVFASRAENKSNSQRTEHPQSLTHSVQPSKDVLDGVPATVQKRALESHISRPTCAQFGIRRVTPPKMVNQKQTQLRQVDVCPAPCYKDFLVMYATPPGNFAFRNPVQGSWFVTYLSDVLTQSNGETSLSQQLTRVIGTMARAYESSGKNSGKKQSPVIYSMLTKDVYFSPKTPSHIISQDSVGQK